MSKIQSQIDPATAQFKQNEAAVVSAIQAFRDLEQLAISAAESKKEKYAKRGMLLPRERLALLLDPGSQFVELSSLAGFQMFDDKDGSGAGGGCIGGIGYVSGRRCLVRVDNYAIKGGTIAPVGMDKALRMQQIALENKLPCVTLAQSGGANLKYATETFAPGGRGFANQARLSAAGIPQITVVHGSATAGGAYQPGLSDYVVMIRQQATMYLAGPPLLKAATGEIADDESLGGAQLHSTAAGTSDYLAEDDADGIRIAREILACLPCPKTSETRTFQAPAYSPDELAGVIPSDPKQPYDVREIIARISDASEFLPFKIEYDQQTMCGHIHIEGYPCGVIGNNGPITPQGAAKAAQFIQLCDQSQVPIIFLHNTTGFMVGTQAESQGIIKHGSKMIQAVANARVPKLSLVIGGSYGAGNYAMCGRGFDPRFIFAWPNSKTAVMGGAQAGKVMRIVSENKMQQMGTSNSEFLDHLEKQTTEMMETQSTAISCSARLWDDGLIDPRDSRRLLGFLLSICRDAEQVSLSKNTFGVSRF